MKNYTSPGCKYNPEGVRCEEHQCKACGFNPEVTAARLKKLAPGYTTHTTDK